MTCYDSYVIMSLWMAEVKPEKKKTLPATDLLKLHNKYHQEFVY